MSDLGADRDRMLARCRAGDVDAFESVYTRWERPLFRYAYWMLGDADEADDVKQETFLKAFGAIGRFDGRCTMQTWLFGICGNLCRDRMKQRMRRPEVSLENGTADVRIAGAGGDPLHLVLAGANEALIVKALEGLPPRQRELILLREVEGLSYQEIRDILHCSLASVKLRLFRARQLWRKRYIQMTQEGDPVC